LGEKASRVGFDWTSEQDVLKKIKEEIQELEVEVREQNKDKILEEFGDLLFTLANMARFLKVNPEEALRRACNKFIHRFQYLEERLFLQNKKWSETQAAELEDLWNESKKFTKSV
jgi:XTP/dITP diphosphohydrolase